MSEVVAPERNQDGRSGPHVHHRAGSFLAVAAAIVIGLSILVALAMLLSHLLGNPPS